MRITKMPLPLLRKCCYCIPLKPGCFILSFLSIMVCLADVGVGLWHLPHYREREPEDNLISMCKVIFSSLCAISNTVTFVSIQRTNMSYLQTSIVFNSVFILCIFLVAIVTCIFRLNKFFERPENIVLIVFALFAGALYALYYLTLINSLYRIMKTVHGEHETLVITSVPTSSRNRNQPRPSYDNINAV